MSTNRPEQAGTGPEPTTPGSRHGSRPRAGALAREARRQQLAAARSIAHFEKGLRRDVGHLMFRVDRQRIAELLEQVAVELREDHVALLRAITSGSTPGA